MKTTTKRKIYISSIFLINIVLIFLIVRTLKKDNKEKVVSKEVDIKEELLLEIKKEISEEFNEEFKREPNKYNFNRENFHELSIYGLNGEVVFIVGEKYFFGAINEDKIIDIVGLFISERENFSSMNISKDEGTLVFDIGNRNATAKLSKEQIEKVLKIIIDNEK